MKYDLCIIGSGLAGLSAAMFAIERGMAVVQAGRSGEINFSSGLLDLLGVYPVAGKKIAENPWAAIEALVRDVPGHPYARLPQQEVRAAFDALLTFLSDAGLPYQRRMDRNSAVLTSLGTAKLTYGMPQSMWPGVAAFEKKPACLIVDIRGLKGFSARQIAAALKQDWPELRTARISFPEMDHLNEVDTEHMANALMLPKIREKFARQVQANLKDEKTVGFPAMLGLHQTQEVITDLERRIGIQIFEIPTLPPSVPGLRLKEAFERELRSRGVRYLSQQRVLSVRSSRGPQFEITIGGTTAEQSIVSRGIILASGRFIGGGLYADRKRIRETVFDLPVLQPDNRTGWHHRNMLDPAGHPVNRAGLEIDDSFRPLDDSRRRVFENLFAAGSILAHNDWTRLKCGAGVSIASAFGAVASFVKHCG